MKLILRVLSGKKYGQRIVVGRGQASTVGRSNAAQYSFDDDHMSSLHFEVENFGSYAEVRDLRSTNRTWLNNNFVTSAPLKHGDRLRAGKTVMAVEIEHTAIVDEAGLTPKPPLLESTSQVAMPQSKAEPVAVLAPGTAGDPLPEDAQPRREELADVDAKLRPNVAATQPPNHRPPLVVATPVHRPEVVVPPPHQHVPQAAPISPTSASTARPYDGGHQTPADSMHQPQAVLPPVEVQPELAAVPVAAPPAMPSPVVPLPPASRPPEPMQPAALKPQAPAVSPPYRTTSVGEARRQSHSPIESVEFSPPVERRPAQATRERGGSNPIVDSSSLFFGPGVEIPGDKRRFRQYERIGDFQYLQNLRTVITALQQRMAVRIVAHFSKIHMIAPQLSDVAPLYPEYPGATTHWPVSLNYRDWESQSVQTVASRLCTNDALLVLVGEFNADLVSAAQEVGAEGVRGFCEAGGYLGWSNPSAFSAYLQLLGTRAWGDVLGPTIDGAIMCNPQHPEVLLAFAAECLESELKSLGFTTVV